MVAIFSVPRRVRMESGHDDDIVASVKPRLKTFSPCLVCKREAIQGQPTQGRAQRPSTWISGYRIGPRQKTLSSLVAPLPNGASLLAGTPFRRGESPRKQAWKANS